MSTLLILDALQTCRGRSWSCMRQEQEWAEPNSHHMLIGGMHSPVHPFEPAFHEMIGGTFVGILTCSRGKDMTTTPDRSKTQLVGQAT